MFGSLTSQLTQTRETSFTRTVGCPFEKVIAFMHHTPNLIKMNIHHEQSSEDSNMWTIQDRMDYRIFSFTFNYSAEVTLYEDGTRFQISAPFGIVLDNRWVVRKLDDGKVEVTENVSIKASFLLMPSAIQDLNKSHEGLHDRLAEKLEAIGRTPEES